MIEDNRLDIISEGIVIVQDYIEILSSRLDSLIEVEGKRRSQSSDQREAVQIINVARTL